MHQPSLIGRRFGRLRVISEARSHSTHRYWNCHCICSGRSRVRNDDLTRGRINSCGCLRREVAAQLKFSHGGSRLPEYRVWECMRRRCFERRHKSFKHYGKRGITVCKRWLNFRNFIADMGRRPHPKLTIERVNNNDNYRPGNCIWASRKVQARNTRRAGRYRRAA